MARALSDAARTALYWQEEDQHKDESRPLRSFRAGIEGLKGSFNNAAGAVSRLVGANDTAQSFENDARINAARAAGIRGRVPTWQEADSLGDYASYATDMVASNLPLAASMLGPGLVAGGIRGTLAGANALRAGLSGAAVQQAREKAAVGAANKVGFGVYGGTSAGENYGRVLNDPDAEGTPWQKAATSLAAGGASAWLGMKPLQGVQDALTKNAGFGRTVGATAALEGITEAGESVISRLNNRLYNSNVNLLDADARREYIDSMLGGAIVGGAYAGAGYGANKLLQPRAQPEPEVDLNPNGAYNIDDMYVESPQDDGERIAHIEEIRKLLLSPGTWPNTATRNALRDELNQVAKQMRTAEGRAYVAELYGGTGDYDPNVAFDTISPRHDVVRLGQEDNLDEALDPQEELDQVMYDPYGGVGDEQDTRGVEFLGKGPANRPYIFDPANSDYSRGVPEKTIEAYAQVDPSSDYDSVDARALAQAEGKTFLEKTQEIVGADVYRNVDAWRGLQPADARVGGADALPFDAAKGVDPQARSRDRYRSTFADIAGDLFTRRAALQAELEVAQRQSDGTNSGPAVRGLEADIAKLDARIETAAGEFLQRLHFVRRTPRYVDTVSEERAFDLTMYELTAGSNERGRILRRAKQNPGIVKTKDGKLKITPGSNRYVEGSLNGERIWIDLRNLTSAMLNKLTDAGALPQQTERMPSNADGKTRDWIARQRLIQRLAAALNAGLVSMLNTGVKFDLRNIPSDTVFWYDKQRNPITLAEIREAYLPGTKKGAEYLNAKAERDRTIALMEAAGYDPRRIAEVYSQLTPNFDPNPAPLPNMNVSSQEVDEAGTKELGRPYQTSLIEQRTGRVDAGKLSPRERSQLRAEGAKQLERIRSEMAAAGYSPAHINYAHNFLADRYDLKSEKRRAVEGLSEGEKKILERNLLADKGIDYLTQLQHTWQQRKVHKTAPPAEMAPREVPNEQLYNKNDDVQRDEIFGEDADGTVETRAGRGVDPEHAYARKAQAEADARRREEELAQQRAEEKRQEHKDWVANMSALLREIASLIGLKDVRLVGVEEAITIVNERADQARQLDALRVLRASKSAMQARVKALLDVGRVDDAVAALDEYVVARKQHFDVSAERQALELLSKRGDPTRVRNIISGRQRGFYDRASGAVYVNPSLRGAYATATLMHEVGHAVMYQKFNALSAKDQAAVLDEYERWRDLYGRTTVTTAKMSKQAIAHAIEAAASGNLARLDGLTADERQAVLSFNEWFADNVAKWADTSAKPKSVVERFFADVAAAIKALLRSFKLRTGQNYEATGAVADFMDALVNQAAAQHAAYEQERVADGGFVGPPPPPGGRGGSTPPPPPPGGRGLAGRLSNWYSHFRRGQQSVLSTRMVDEVRAFIEEHATAAEKRALYRAARSEVMQRAMTKALGSSARAVLQIRTDPNMAAAYLYALTRLGVIQTGPQTTNVVNGMEGRLNDMYTQVFGELSAEAQSQAVLDAIAADTLQHNNDSLALPADFVNNQHRRMARAIRDKVMGAYRKLYTPVFGLPAERLNDMDIPVMSQLSNLLFNPSTARGVPQGFLRAKSQRRAEFDKRYLALVKDLDTAQREAIAAVFNNPDLLRTASEDVRTKHKALRALFDDLYKYLEEAGVTFEKRQNYTPWMFNEEYVTAHMDEFVALASKEQYQGYWRQMKDKWITARRVPADITLEDFIRERLLDLTRPEGVQTADTESGHHNPGFRFMNPRELNFLQSQGTAEDRVELAKFFEPSLDRMLGSYISSAVKRAEFARRFGLNGEQLTKMLDEARTVWGASPQELAYAQATVDSALGMYGAHTRKWLEDNFKDTELPKYLKSMLVGEGAGTINPKLQNHMGWIITYQNYRLLALSAFMSFTDPFTLLARNGSFRDTFASVREAAKTMWDASSGDAQQLNALLDTVNTIDYHSMHEEIMREFGQHFSPTQQKLNDVLFKYNGVEYLTQFARRVGTIGAEKAIVKWYEGQSENDIRKLEELGIEVGDVRVENGHLVFLSPAEYKQASKAEKARNDRLIGAVRQFVDTTTLRPDATNRPTWMNDPHAALVTHLKTFPFVFHDNIIKRLGKEAQHGDFAPLLATAVTFMAITLFADWLRDMVKYGPEGASWKANWGPEEYVAYAFERSGLMGRDELLQDVLAPVLQGDVVKGAAEALGPTASQLLTISRYGPSERELPLQVLYRNWD